MNSPFPATDLEDAYSMSRFADELGSILEARQDPFDRAHSAYVHQLGRIVRDLVVDARVAADNYLRLERTITDIIRVIAEGHFDARTSWHNVECLTARRPCAACCVINEALRSVGLPSIQDIARHEEANHE